MKGSEDLFKRFERLSNIVNYEGCSYYVDTVYTSQNTFETMIFYVQGDFEEMEDVTVLNVPEKYIDWGGLYTEIYTNPETATKRHYEIIKDIGKYL